MGGVKRLEISVRCNRSELASCTRMVKTSWKVQHYSTREEFARRAPVLYVLVKLVEVLADVDDRIRHSGQLLLRALRRQVLDG